MNGNSQTDEDENESQEDRTVEEKNSEREDLISASPALVSSPANAEPAAVRLMRSPTPYPKDLKILAKYIRHAGTSGGNRNSRGNYEDASPQRISSSNGAVGINSEDQLQQQQQSQMAMEYATSEQISTTITHQQITIGNGNTATTSPENLYSSSNYERELVVMPVMATPNVSQIREARVTQASINSSNNNNQLSNSNGGPMTPNNNNINNNQYRTEDNISMVQQQQFQQHQRISMDQQQQMMIINSNITKTTKTEWLGMNPSSISNFNHQSQQPQMQQNVYQQQQSNQDLVNNNINIQRSSLGVDQGQLPPGHVTPTTTNTTAPPQPPPYHIAKTYTKKSPEDLMIYDSFRHLKSQTNRDLYDVVQGGGGGVQRNLITPTPSIISATAREVQIINGLDENRNNLPLPPPPLELEDPEEMAMIDEEDVDGTRGPGERRNGMRNSITSEELPPPPPPIAVDEMDSLSLLSKESSTHTSPTKSTGGGGVRKSESGHSWIFGLHRNPRVLQYQIQYSDCSELGFTVAQMPNEVSHTHFCNLFRVGFRKMSNFFFFSG